MAKLRLSLILNVLLCCSLFYTGWKWRSAEERLNQIPQGSERASLQAQSASSLAVLPEASRAAASSAPGLAPALPIPGNIPPKKKAAANLLAPGFVKSVSSYISLSTEQQESLLERFQEEGPSSAAEREAIIAEVLGDDTAEKYRRSREERERKDEAEEIDREVFTLSRKLSLTERQEAQVRATLKDVRNALRPLYQEVQARSEEAVALHSAGDEARETLRERYAEMKARIGELRTQERELLNDALRPVLNDAQMNALLEYQADESGG